MMKPFMGEKEILNSLYDYAMMLYPRGDPTRFEKEHLILTSKQYIFVIGHAHYTTNIYILYN